jgi:hypothetical protein
MSALVNLMQFVVIALLLVCVAMMVTLQLAKAGHTEGEAQRRGAGAGLFGARGMTRRVRGKRSATTFVDGPTAATSMSCNSDKGRSAGATKETG